MQEKKKKYSCSLSFGICPNENTKKESLASWSFYNYQTHITSLLLVCLHLRNCFGPLLQLTRDNKTVPGRKAQLVLVQYEKSILFAFRI